jgi:hypothetical protein
LSQRIVHTKDRLLLSLEREGFARCDEPIIRTWMFHLIDLISQRETVPRRLFVSSVH